MQRTARLLSDWGLPPLRVPALRWDMCVPRSALGHAMRCVGRQVCSTPSGPGVWRWVRSHLRVVKAKRLAADSVRWNYIRSCRHAELRW